MTVSLPGNWTAIPPQCGECGEVATCAYSYGGPSYYACPAHDPTRSPGWMTVTTTGFTYTTNVLPTFVPAEAVTGGL